METLRAIDEALVKLTIGLVVDVDDLVGIRRKAVEAEADMQLLVAKIKALAKEWFEYGL